jgi:hypothetical protein
MVLVFRLLSLSPKIARAFRDFAIGFAALTHADLDAIKKWFESTPQEQAQMLREQPALSKEIEGLFVEYQHHKDTQYQVSALRREMLTLPGLPDEGY